MSDLLLGCLGVLPLIAAGGGVQDRTADIISSTVCFLGLHSPTVGSVLTSIQQPDRPQDHDIFCFIAFPGVLLGGCINHVVGEQAALILTGTAQFRESATPAGPTGPALLAGAWSVVLLLLAVRLHHWH